MSYDIHLFYCIKCGQQGISLPRKKSQQRSKMHRKKLYCPNCQLTINHVECKSDKDVYEFKELFEEGFFKPEIEESIKESSDKNYGK